MNRRTFIHNLGIISASVLIPFPLKASVFSDSFNEDINREYIAILNEAKKNFRLKNIYEAERTVYKAIQLRPEIINSYDLLKKIYYSQGDFVRPIQLFDELRSQYTHRHEFEDRFSKTLRVLSLSNAKQEAYYIENFAQSKDLIFDSFRVNVNAQKRFGNIRCFEENLANIETYQLKKRKSNNCKTASENSSRDYRKSCKSYTKRRQGYTYNLKSEGIEKVRKERKNCLAKLDKISHTESLRYTNCIRTFKKLSFRMVSDCNRAKDYEQSEAILTEILRYDDKDTQSWKKLKDVLKAQKKYQTIISLAKQRHHRDKENFFGLLGYIKTLIEYGDSSQLNEAISLLKDADFPPHRLTINLLLSKAYLNLRDFENAEQAIFSYIDYLGDDKVLYTNYEYIALNIAYAKIKTERGMFNQAAGLLNDIINDGKSNTEENPIALRTVKDMVLEFGEKEQLKVLLAKVYIQNGESHKAKRIYRKILRKNSDNVFVKRCLKKV